MSYLDELEDDAENSRIEGRFAPGHSGNPLGRPRGSVSSSRVPPVSKSKGSGTSPRKPGPKKKGLDFEPITEGVMGIEDSLRKNQMAFLNAIWKKIQEGDEPLQKEMLKIVMTNKTKADELAGLQDLAGVEVSDLLAVSEQIKREAGL